MYMVWLITLLLLLLSASSNTVLARLPYESPKTRQVWDKKVIRGTKIEVRGSTSGSAGQGH
ncbi:unnamed protein product [Arabidopsis thaliana]|uniref:(thale cress) hypothetical protein n=1 Tax=Arabidopsis thaliana TaxID=3702 RepID=A0A7G2FI07_ARATH|nr:unnamed protein product [Arabidopsis thaliana]